MSLEKIGLANRFVPMSEIVFSCGDFLFEQSSQLDWIGEELVVKCICACKCYAATISLSVM